MMLSVAFKVVHGLNKCRTIILATITVALILVLFAHCKKSTPQNTGKSDQSKKPAEVSDSISSDKEISERMKQLVRDLEYPDKVAEDFNRMTMAWRDEQGRPVLIRWKGKLSNAHQNYQQGKISRRKVAKIEESILRELCETTEKQFSNKNLVFELTDVIQNRQTNCLGYSQLMYIIGNAIGLSVRPIDVLDPVKSVEGDAKKAHIACIMDLSDGRSVMTDISLLYETPSRAFKLEDHFVKVGNYWKLRYYFNRLLIHKKIRLLDGKGLLAGIYSSRGYVHHSKGEYDQGILDYTKAIEIDPTFAKACINRGNIYADKGEYDRAILDYTKAIEIDPNYAKAYTNRGIAFNAKGEHDRAIADHTQAIELNPKFADAYNNRGIIYADKGEYDRAILDYTKAIEIDPKDADVYVNRGLTYVDKFEFDRAILDFTQAIELNPKLTNAYINRGGCYHVKDEYDQAMLDITQAIEINPKDANVYLNRGGIYEDKGEFDRAILDYKKAIEIDPGFAVAYLGRGEVYAELGKSEEAKKDLLRTLELDPELGEFVKQVSEQYELDLKLD